jgi:hypothetical protein
VSGAAVGHKLFVPYVMRYKLDVRITNIIKDGLHTVTAMGKRSRMQYDVDYKN